MTSIKCKKCGEENEIYTYSVAKSEYYKRNKTKLNAARSAARRRKKNENSK